MKECLFANSACPGLWKAGACERFLRSVRQLMAAWPEEPALAQP